MKQTPFSEPPSEAISPDSSSRSLNSPRRTIRVGRTLRTLAVALASSAALGASALACDGAGSRAPAFVVSVLVESDPGSPVTGATVSSRGAALATTGDEGRVRLELGGSEGELVSLNVNCPDGYHAPAEPITFSLLRLTGGASAPEYRARCAPTSRSVVVAVRAEHGPDLPVTYMGREVARTDGSGAAHVLLDLKPGTSFRLTLDTSESDALRPRSPSETFSVPDRNGIQVFEREFQVSRKKNRVRRRKKRPAGPRRL